jgi:hypothetical protein
VKVAILELPLPRIQLKMLQLDHDALALRPFMPQVLLMLAAPVA